MIKQIITFIIIVMAYPLNTSSYYSQDFKEPIRVIKSPGYHARDVYIVASIIWNEARGESFHGKYAVASTIYNRANGDIREFSRVVREDNWLGDSYREIHMTGDISTECKIAKSMFEGKFMPMGDYTHFYNPSKVKPYWKSFLKNKKRIGNHIFGKIS